MVLNTNEQKLLYPLLKSVSRSFYLTLAVLPADVRSQMAVAYLYARAADSIADTELLPRGERLRHLASFRRWLLDPEGAAGGLRELQVALSPVGPQSPERILLERLEECHRVFERFSDDDKALVLAVVNTLTTGMVRDLTKFPGASHHELTALATLPDLDEYTYYAAGCVGEFWTRMMTLHRPALREWDPDAMAKIGVRFGKGLQLTNVLRDIPKDLRRGRCYIPETLLEDAGLKPADLLDPLVLPRLTPVLVLLLRMALEHLDQAWLYTMAIPRREWRVRLACIWPILFALNTLRRISRFAGLLDPDCLIKITRGEVYRDILLSSGAVGSTRLLTGYYGRLRKTVAC